MDANYDFDAIADFFKDGRGVGSLDDLILHCGGHFYDWTGVTLRGSASACLSMADFGSFGTYTKDGFEYDVRMSPKNAFSKPANFPLVMLAVAKRPVGTQHTLHTAVTIFLNPKLCLGEGSLVDGYAECTQTVSPEAATALPLIPIRVVLKPEEASERKFSTRTPENGHVPVVVGEVRRMRRRVFTGNLPGAKASSASFHAVTPGNHIGVLCGVLSGAVVVDTSATGMSLREVAHASHVNYIKDVIDAATESAGADEGMRSVNEALIISKRMSVSGLLAIMCSPLASFLNDSFQTPWMTPGVIALLMRAALSPTRWLGIAGMPSHRMVNDQIQQAVDGRFDPLHIFPNGGMAYGIDACVNNATDIAAMIESQAAVANSCSVNFLNSFTAALHGARCAISTLSPSQAERGTRISRLFGDQTRAMAPDLFGGFFDQAFRDDYDRSAEDNAPFADDWLYDLLSSKALRIQSVVELHQNMEIFLRTGCWKGMDFRQVLDETDDYIDCQDDEKFEDSVKKLHLPALGRVANTVSTAFSLNGVPLDAIGHHAILLPARDKGAYLPEMAFLQEGTEEAD